ncbi:hypothetical protein LTR91_023676 [Friedmanniomyces endolithicus]|uniref:Uncharacterized protein n=1 Tax=Friedmanniomyces endolithicus TaxID=329885 RepID=A0AAN6K183_9PEZI|nr:hypothetical protein LTR94_009898 [Friedmanniomyces endolithicus]KAK0783437.1 hypothetical protein LTR75_014136 [Friedmanniomyces endolithicus]KAK0794741.1 hypothetical protein LTR59_007659 [Friedmanniomyces endolithicus]KAK0803066.1 hypothetical protein LTR38_006252 [Friedmanniomyces endolithicus]KAK0849896.1 hypothetical protein LTS02_013400 [Friedmanniomyces endolithicus]
MAPQESYKLVTVNNNPERAKMIVGKVIEAVKDQYTIVHAANAQSEYPFLIHRLWIFAASMWSPEQSSHVFAQAREINPECKTLAIPQGLQVEKGPEAVVEWIKEELPGLLGS